MSIPLRHPLIGFVLLGLLACLPRSGRAEPPQLPQLPQSQTVPPLRVCADPNNLPFSNAAGEGFENRLAQMVGAALGAKVEYVWWAQRRGFIRNTLKAGKCDVVMGVPSGYDMTLNTRPYYRSSYVFVYRDKEQAGLRSIDDARLERLRIGVHTIGTENPPPAIALARSGIIDNVTGYSIYGDYREANPPARLIEAVAKGDIDVAIAWGPMAGYFVQRIGGLVVMPIAEPEAGALPFRFSVAMGVRKGERDLQGRLNAALDRLQPGIERLLHDYGVPLEPVEPSTGNGQEQGRRN